MCKISPHTFYFKESWWNLEGIRCESTPKASKNVVFQAQSNANASRQPWGSFSSQLGFPESHTVCQDLQTEATFHRQCWCFLMKCSSACNGIRAPCWGGGRGRLMDEPHRGFSLTRCKQGGRTSDLPRWGRTGLLLFPSKTLCGFWIWLAER